jgi:iron complex transport system ATP-binding protein
MVSALQVEALVFEYEAGPRALDGVSLALEPGELLIAIGPNGSGKSTLLRCCAGQLAPRVGRILLGNRDIAAVAPRARAVSIAVVPQFLPRLPDVGVRDFVLGGRYAHYGRWRGPSHADFGAVHDALEACDAGDLAARRMNELSGGQRQRVLIARAVAQEAQVLLVDEPTSSLDPEHQIRVFELLARLTREGRGAIVVTHELNLASQFATRLVLLDRGRVVANGDAESVLRREVLVPVYGPHLHFGRIDPRRPFVVPWREPTPDAGG